MDRCYESHMDNGCPKCEKLTKEYLTEWGRSLDIFCLVHQLDQAEQAVYAAMNEVERIKQKLKQEKQNELSDNKR